MSKSRGNVIDPWSVLAERGADALRWYMFSSGSPWTPKRVYVDGIDEATRQFLLTLWNTYSFFVTYANLDGWTPPAAPAAPSTHVLDRWIALAAAPHRAHGHRRARALRRARRRAGARRARRRPLELVRAPVAAALLEVVRSGRARDAARVPRARSRSCSRRSARSSPTRCTATSRAPTTSVHLTDWPDVDDAAIDDALEAEMALARHARVARARGAQRRQDRRAPTAPARDRAARPRGETLRDDVVQEIADELNVKRFEVVDVARRVCSRTASCPNFRALGPRARQARCRA